MRSTCEARQATLGRQKGNERQRDENLDQHGRSLRPGHFFFMENTLVAINKKPTPTVPVECGVPRRPTGMNKSPFGATRRGPLNHRRVSCAPATGRVRTSYTVGINSPVGRLAVLISQTKCLKTEAFDPSLSQRSQDRHWGRFVALDVPKNHLLKSSPTPCVRPSK